MTAAHARERIDRPRVDSAGVRGGIRSEPSASARIHGRSARERSRQCDVGVWMPRFAACARAARPNMRFESAPASSVAVQGARRSSNGVVVGRAPRESTGSAPTPEHVKGSEDRVGRDSGAPARDPDGPGECLRRERYRPGIGIDRAPPPSARCLSRRSGRAASACGRNTASMRAGGLLPSSSLPAASLRPAKTQATRSNERGGPAVRGPPWSGA